MTRFEALQLSLKAFSSQQAMATELGVTQPTVWRWLNQSKQVPAEYVLRVEAATGVSRHDLRPDIYPREEMVDRLQGDRFCGIDRQIAARQQMTAAAPSASKAA